MQPVQGSLTPSHRMCCRCSTSLSSHPAHTYPFYNLHFPIYHISATAPPHQTASSPAQTSMQPTPSTSSPHQPWRPARKSRHHQRFKGLAHLPRFVEILLRIPEMQLILCNPPHLSQKYPKNILILLWNPLLDTQQPQPALCPPSPERFSHIYFVILPSGTRS